MTDKLSGQLGSTTGQVESVFVALDYLMLDAELVIDRPAGTFHPRPADISYTVDMAISSAPLAGMVRRSTYFAELCQARVSSDFSSRLT